MRIKRKLAVFAAVTMMVAMACSSAATVAPVTKVKLQLQWVPQAQFAGYFRFRSTW